MRLKVSLTAENKVKNPILRSVSAAEIPLKSIDNEIKLCRIKPVNNLTIKKLLIIQHPAVGCCFFMKQHL